MLSRATYAGRICLSCRHQLRLNRPRPLPTTTRLPRLGLPRYTTSANDDADSKLNLSESEADKSAKHTSQDVSVPEPEASEYTPDPVLSPESKLARSSAETVSAPESEATGTSTGRVPTSETSSEGYKPEAAPTPEEELPKLEIDTSPASEAELAWARLEGPSQAPARHSHQRRDSSGVDVKTAPAPEDEHPGFEIDTSPPSEAELAWAHAEAPSQSPVRRPRQRRGRNGIDVETASLGMNILGKEGHTIVLRDRERRRKEPALLEEETLAKDLDIEGSLEEQKRDLTLEETRRNIEELQPGDSRDLLGREFNQILNTLMDGFKSSQLEDYVCHFMSKKDGRSEEMPRAQKQELLRRLTGRAELRWPVRPRYGWIRKQISWKPPRNYAWGKTRKEKLALAIMRACWHLQVMEETPYIGEVNVHVDPHILNLLLVENRSLRAIQGSLGVGAGVKIIPEKEMMQITASRSKCDVALDQLDRFVSRIEEATIPLSALGREQLPQGILERLSSLTGASVAYSGTKDGSRPVRKRGEPITPSKENSDAIRIGWLKSANRPDTVESLQHVIFRLLLSASNPGNTAETVKTVLDTENEVNPKDFVLVRQHGDNHELPWHLRDQVWSRLVYPTQPKPSQHKRSDVAPPEEVSTGETSAGSRGVTNSELEGQENPEATADTDVPSETQSSQGPKQNGTIASSALRLPIYRHGDKSAIEGWSQPFTRTSSVFGHLLHPFSTEGQHTPVNYRKMVTPGSLSFKPVTPPVAALSNLAAYAGDTVTTTLLIHLWPKQDHAPALEFHIEVPEQDGLLEWETTSKKLMAVRSSWAAHVRLPLHPVDVSVRQSLASKMNASELASCAPLRTFFENSKLDLSSDLLTPPSITLPLPASLLKREGETKEVEFHFMGLELRTCSTVRFRSNHLSLTSIEAGQQGRRAELALHAADVQPASQVSDRSRTYVAELLRAAKGKSLRDHAKTYLDEVLGVARGSYFPWVGSRPFDASSLEDS